MFYFWFVLYTFLYYDSVFDAFLNMLYFSTTKCSELSLIWLYFIELWTNGLLAMKMKNIEKT